MKAVTVGISGGVDSSVAALLLLEKGFRVSGCFNLSFETENSLRELDSAREICRTLGIPLRITDLRDDFKRDVINGFIGEYIHGRTPNPCCICNPLVKWKGLLSAMKADGSDMVATGHYVFTACESGRFYIRADRLSGKDQSYALYRLTQEEIRSTVFPLGGMKKDEVRDIARREGLHTADRHDSQDICFIPDNDHASFIRENTGLLSEKLKEEASGIDWDGDGDYINENGDRLGRHKGMINYTVGQRKGLGIALGKRIFVKELRPATGEIVLADNDRLYTDTAYIDNVCLQKALSADQISGTVKIRYSDKGTEGRMEKTEDSGVFRISFAEAVRAPAPGQAAVIYDTDGGILAGGIIR